MDRVGIWNRALSLVRARQVASPDEMSVSAVVCYTHYQSCLDMLLEQNPWTFATRWFNPARVEPEANTGWAHAFPIPADTVKVWDVQNAFDGLAMHPRFDNEIPYEKSFIGSTPVILTNHPEIRVQITERVGEERFPPTFCLALTHLLAMNIAVPLVGVELGSRLSAENQPSYERALSSANANDAAQVRLPPRRDRYSRRYD